MTVTVEDGQSLKTRVVTTAPLTEGVVADARLARANTAPDAAAIATIRFMIG